MAEFKSDLELPQFKKGSIEWKMCLKIAELTQVKFIKFSIFDIYKYFLNYISLLIYFFRSDRF